MKAKLLQDNLTGFNGHAALFELDPPIEYEGEKHQFVVASAVDNGWAHETYLFPSDKDGNVSDFGELPGSMRGTTSHAEVIESAGYKIEP